MSQEILTFCAICGAHCAAKATVDNGKIVKWEQDKESGLHYLPCTVFKGAAAAEISESPDRLKYPLKRVGGRGESKWQRISWDEAFGDIAKKLNELKGKYGPQCLGTAVGEPKALEFVWLERFSSAFGTPNSRTPLAL